jgi:hypothetical protein
MAHRHKGFSIIDFFVAAGCLFISVIMFMIITAAGVQ